MGRDTVVGIATRYALDGPGFENPRRLGIFSSPRKPVQNVSFSHPASSMGQSDRDVALTIHPHLAPRLGM